MKLAACWVAAAATLVVTGLAHAQTVRGRVTGADGSVASGATVLLLDSAGATRGGAFVDNAGVFVISTSPGRYVVEVQRIGLRSTRSDWFNLAAGQTIEMPVTVTVEAVALPEITAVGETRCGKDTDPRVATVWEEARKALHAAALTNKSQLYRFQIRRDYRRLALPSLRVVRDSSVFQLSMSSGSPFTSLAADSLIRNGFIQEKSDGTFYNGPDAEVLLSNNFADAFCFNLKANSAGKLIGLTFQPLRRNVPSSINGTLWIDRATSELRFIEYKYVGSSVPPAARGLIGGLINFKRLTGGPWIVDKWHIRMPVLTDRQVAAIRGGPYREIVLTGLSEEGAEVLSVAGRGQ